MRKNSGYLLVYKPFNSGKYKKGMRLYNVTVFRNMEQSSKREFFDSIVLIEDAELVEDSWVKVRFNIE